MSKKNKEYWQNRHNQWLDNQDKSDNQATVKLNKKYSRMSKEYEKEIASYFAKYGKDNLIEYRNLLESLSTDERNLLYQSMGEFAVKYPQHSHLMPVRESIYNLNRLQGLHYSTNLKLLELGAIEHDLLEKHLLDTYGKNYNKLMKELGLGNSFVAVNDQVMRDTIFTKWVNDENFSDRIWKNKLKMSSYMQTEFRDSVARGDNYYKTAKVMSKRFEVGMYDAKRLVFTESSFVLNQSHTKAYIDAGVTEYTISAIRDSKTSQICRSLDGQTFRFEDMEVGVNFPPFHSWCRTTFIGNLDGLLD
ncbi:minor capsid protein [Alkalihalobacillus trypoxylicola]|uniref:Phage head morphogenesis domain-containing protein n=1 Tax=Alkalihalobacillus trypoxylicola TaxID=519424 RepID=A0A161QAQ9_9BACI|nr:minor capsid protein [Alkalihalobacillus trypoxylicola]KYG34917.1 hypothetical protein AZF04_00870 [Alkalihalobacillus trypoxylicola]